MFFKKLNRHSVKTNPTQNTPPYTHCLNCGAELQGMFCHQCGQKATSQTPSVGSFIFEYFNHAFIWDANFLRTTWTLISRPGKLTNDFLAGKFSSQEHPLKLNMFLLFVFITLFALFSTSGKITSSMHEITHNESVRAGFYVESLVKTDYAQTLKYSPRDTVQLLAPLFLPEIYPELFSNIQTLNDAENEDLDLWIASVPQALITNNQLIKAEGESYCFNTEANAGKSELDLLNSVWGEMISLLAKYFPMLFLFTAPMLAMSLRLVQRKDRRPRLHHFIFALHYTALMELLMLIIYVVHLLFAPPMIWLQWVLTIGSCVYLTLAFRNVYRINNWGIATLKALLTSLIYCLICLAVLVVILFVACIIVAEQYHLQ